MFLKSSSKFQLKNLCKIGPQGQILQRIYKQIDILQTNLQTAQTNSQKSLQTKVDVYKNTNDTNNEVFVSGVSCENAEIEEPTVGSELKKLGFSF